MTDTSTAPALRFDNVRLARGGRVILDNVSFEVPSGVLTVILGPSGAGKSTLLHASTGELPPSAGRIEVLGQVYPLRNQALFALRRRIGVLLQGNGLLTDLSVFENIALPLRVHTDLPDVLIQRLVRMKLNAVGLMQAEHLAPQQLSGGMARRVALARALVMDPPLVLYDEPLTGLDPIASGVVLELIRGLNQSLGMTSVVITHHVHESLAIADHVLVVADGRIGFDGTPDELADCRDPLIRQFLDGAPDGPIPFDYRAAGIEGSPTHA